MTGSTPSTLPHPPAPPPAASPSHLPRQLTSFVGREREIAAVATLLTAEHAGARLVTLTGAGGCGKTRLALTVAAHLAERYPDGVRLVEFAALADPTLVPGAVATALDVREAPGRPLTATLVDALRPQALLLVLDNCEHLVEACATLADTLLRGCPTLHLLATSRQALGVAGESVWRVPSLALPDPQQRPPAADLARVEAIQLFVERARLVQPGFALTGQNAAAVAQVCRRLDGLPLAIELAAARVPVLTVEQLAARLDDRFHVLAGGSRTAPSRQRTLRAAVAWSYDLLSPPERALFRRLAVFAGGWTLEAAEAVGAGGSCGSGIAAGEVLGLLARLVDQSLVVAEAGATGAMRYRLLETLREYALERLAASGEGEALQHRQAAYFMQLAERLAGSLPPSARWARLEEEHDNLRTALGWVLARGEATLGLRLAGAVWRFWLARGHAGEGRRWLERLLGAGDAAPAPVRAEVLAGAGTVAMRQHDLAPARARLQEALGLYRALADAPGQARVLHELGILAMNEDDGARAGALLEEGLALRRALGDRRGVVDTLFQIALLAAEQGDLARAGTLLTEAATLSRDLGDEAHDASVVATLGFLARLQGDYPRARALLAESLARAWAARWRWGTASALAELGLVAALEGDLLRARALLAESLALYRDLGLPAYVARCLELLAGVAGAQGQPIRAARLYGAAAAQREALGARRWSSDRAPYEHHLAAARAQLDEAAWAAAWAEGRAQPPEWAIAYALEAAAPAARHPARVIAPPPATVHPASGLVADAGTPAAPPARLTAREVEVLRLIAAGQSNRAIADALCISVRTVNRHITNLYTKIGARGKADATAYALRRHLA